MDRLSNRKIFPIESGIPDSRESLMDARTLREWFLEEKRDLPWRRSPSGYQVWISEVMLQQTQVSVVIPYYERWMIQFPDVKSLAAASLEQVIKAWEGLGYYSRARHLHETAKVLMERHGGKLPSTYEELEKLKGFGPYTIGAILSFAYGQKAAAVDGNVLRVLSRYFLVEDDIGSGKVQKKMRQLTESLLPERDPQIVMEALIELGAVVCKKKPQCSLCPIQDGCLALRSGKAEALPYKKNQIQTVALKREVSVIFHGDALLIRKEKKGKVMADLYEFPYDKTFHFDTDLVSELEPVKQSFTRFRVELFPRLLKATRKEIVEDYEWVPWKEANALPFSSGHRRILKRLYAYFTHRGI